MSKILLLTTAALVLGASPVPAQQPIAASWCTHSTAQRFAAYINADRQLDALCHDGSGNTWVAIRDGSVLVERWSSSTVRFCIHAGATLHVGDVNGDGKADLICRDPGRIWIDYFADNRYYQGTDWWLDTNWCTHAGTEFLVGDENGDSRTDLVCRGENGWRWVDYADANGRFGGSDRGGRSVDLEIVNMFPTPSAMTLRVRNTGIAGRITLAACRWAGGYSGQDLNISIAAGAESTVSVRNVVSGSPVCWVEGRSLDGSVEIYVSNNRFPRQAS